MDKPYISGCYDEYYKSLWTYREIINLEFENGTLIKVNDLTKYAEKMRSSKNFHLDLKRKNMSFRLKSLGVKEVVVCNYFDGIRIYNWNGYTISDDFQHGASKFNTEAFFRIQLDEPITYQANVEGICHIILNMIGDGLKEAILFECDYHAVIRPALLGLKSVLHMDIVEDKFFYTVFNSQIENVKYRITFSWGSSGSHHPEGAYIQICADL